MDSTPPANPWPTLSFSDLPDREPAFIAEPHFPLGGLVVLEGPRGAGKSWIAADLAAFVSREKECFGKVLFIGSPASLTNAVKPRLQAAGADFSQIKVIEPSRVFSEEDGTRHLNLTLLSGFLSQEAPSLVVIDPIDPYVNKEMGKFAEMLRDLAIEHDCTILAVRRLPQTPTGRPAKTGPEDLSSWAESVVLCARDPEDSSKRLLAHARSVLAPEAKTTEFSIEEGRIRWGNVREMTAEELLQALRPKGPADALAAAMDFLKERIEAGERKVEHLQRDARESGISGITLLRAKKALGLKSIKERWDWYWQFPAKPEKNDDHLAPVISRKNDDHLDDLAEDVPPVPLEMNRAERRRMEREAHKLAEGAVREEAGTEARA